MNIMHIVKFCDTFIFQMMKTEKPWDIYIDQYERFQSTSQCCLLKVREASIYTGNLQRD